MRRREEFFNRLTGTFAVICIDKPDGIQAPEKATKVKIYDEDLILRQSAANIPVRNKLTDLAYVLFTSGSTGFPKGAMLRHDGVINHIFAEFGLLGLGEGFRFLQSASVVSDISIWQLISPVLRGGATVIIDKADQLNFEMLVSILNRERVDLVEFTPLFVESFLDWLEVNGQTRALLHLKTIIVTGEEVPKKLVERWMAHFPSVSVVNAYGPCEASDDVTQQYLTPRIVAESDRLPIGSPIPNMNVVILDKHRQLAPFGAAGEIYIIGVGVGEGYLNDSDATTERFLPNPFTELDGPTMYRTGDLGSWREDGGLEYHGRMDGQVKVLGYRIEVPEIEAALKKIPKVKDAVIDVRKNNQAKVILVAFIVPDDMTTADSNAIKHALRQLLPPYMIPAYFVLLERLPMNLGGKIDRAAIGAISPRQDDQGDCTAVLSPAESKIVELFAEILEVKKSGAATDFFELGGDSIQAIKLLSRINKNFKRELELKDIFLFSTPRMLAQRIAETEEAEPVKIPEPADNVQYPITPGQKRIWLLSQLEQGLAYNVFQAYQVKGRLDKTALQAAVQAILDRWEILRTVFVFEENEIYQRVLPDMPAADVLTDVTGRNYSGGVGELLQQAYGHRFDLGKGPMLAVTVASRSEESHVFILNIHHIVCDGWSIDILFEELISCYHASLEGRQPELRPLPIQYKEFALLYQDRMREKEFERLREFWLRQLSVPVAPLQLPADFARPAVFSETGATRRFRISETDWTGIKKFCHTRRTTPFSFLLFIIQAYLARICQTNDVITGVPVTVRSDDMLQHQIGMFVNTIFIRTVLDPERSVLENFHTVAANFALAIEHQHYPFELLASVGDARRDRSRSPLFDVMVTLHDEKGGDMAAALSDGTVVERVEYDIPTSKFDLSFDFFDRGNSLEAAIEYRTDLFRAERIERMFLHVEAFIRDVLGSQNKPLRSVNFLPASERTKVKSFSAGPVGGLQPESFMEAFARNVNMTPRKTALVAGGISMTYGELSGEISALAKVLVSERGIRKGDVVGISVNRTKWMVIAPI